MQEIKEILEKIERPNKDELVPAWWIRKNILSFVDQALVKLKEEPEQGEFTKSLKRKTKEMLQKLPEIDKAFRWSDKEKQYFTEFIEILSKWHEKACDIIDQLHAENKQLVDGQVAMKEAGS